MFTKYTGVNIPQNYSGNRFHSPLEDTKTTVHKATDSPPVFSKVRTSVSPSFQEVIDKTVIENNTDENYIQADNTLSNEEEYECETCNVEPEESKDEQCGNVHLEKENSLIQLINSVGKDDLLLIALIVLLSSDKDANSIDAIVILALLLLYH